DKALSVTIALLLVMAARKLKPREERRLMMLIVGASALLIPFHDVRAEEDFLGSFTPETYGAQNGLVSAEIASITQTDDGYIWVGTYAGLFRYDGYTYKKILDDKHINSITVLYGDARNRIWIGTSDSGLAVYDQTTQKITLYTTVEGLSSNSVKSICEDDSGNIYVGTVKDLSVVRPNGTVTTYEEWDDIYGVHSLCHGINNTVAGITGDGLLFFLKDEEIFTTRRSKMEDGSYYTAVSTSQFGGTFIVGTSSDYVETLHFAGNTLFSDRSVKIENTKFFNYISYAPEYDGYFYCCEDGMGFIDRNSDEHVDLSGSEFGKYVSSILVDYQNNIWFASRRQGLCRFSKNLFVDVFRKSGIPADGVNCIIIKDDMLYMGKENGISVLNRKTNSVEEIEALRFFDNITVTHMTRDSKDNIWISTTDSVGLYKLTPEGEVIPFEPEIGGAENYGIVRELPDGTLLISSNKGLLYSDGVNVTDMLGPNDGITAEILSMIRLYDGTVLVGSDGDGVYIIKDHKVRGTINEKDGLDSPVIRKIVKIEDGIIFVTSNAIYYQNTSGIIKRLDAFPYSNNYDVQVSIHNNAWITSSAGVYVVALKDLIENNDYNYMLLNSSRGFYSSLTSEADNLTLEDELFLCCDDGVKTISMSNYNTFDSDYSIRISSLTVGEEEVYRKHGIYEIPPVFDRVQIEVSVLNYTFSNPLIHVYLEGVDDPGITYHQSERIPLVFSSLPYGNYKLHVQVMNEDNGKKIREDVFTIKKEAQIFEYNYFKVYAAFVMVMILLFVGWFVANIRQRMMKMKDLQKEATTDHMTGLLNKMAVETELTAAFREKDGVLLMIDLDSFKLVNDIYGHDMGDKVLIRTAEIIRSVVRVDDICGRVGGDEFVAFLKNNVAEVNIMEKTRNMNQELIRSARELMGDDMKIPLGISVGAAVVPEDGREYEDVIKKADKALLHVKKHGKHDYAMYKDVEKAGAESDNRNYTLEELCMILGERLEKKRAYQIDMDKLGTIYRLLERVHARYDQDISIIEFTLKKPNNIDVIPEFIADAFYELLGDALRSSDTLTKVGDNQFLILLTDTGEDGGKVVADRIRSTWYADPAQAEYLVHFEMGMIGGQNKKSE
ncbi:MAG: diguanylate cyclase, partial [Lachnospiraceae bacterium]|nr:diguanylate cyclase [Lachnospiraceae bacterium]